MDNTINKLKDALKIVINNEKTLIELKDALKIGMTDKKTLLEQVKKLREVVEIQQHEIDQIKSELRNIACCLPGYLPGEKKMDFEIQSEDQLIIKKHRGGK